jgi:hypothetical protein
MNLAVSGACDVASDHAAPRWAPLCLALGIRYAERVWSMQMFGLVGHMERRSALHHRPNPYATPSCQEAKRGCAEDEVFRQLLHGQAQAFGVTDLISGSGFTGACPAPNTYRGSGATR